MASGAERRLMLLITLGDDEVSVGRVIEALDEFTVTARRSDPKAAVHIPDSAELTTEMAMTPRAAFCAPARHIPLTAARGAIAAEMVMPYPPEIPVLVPGERITAPIIASYWRAWLPVCTWRMSPIHP